MIIIKAKILKDTEKKFHNKKVFIWGVSIVCRRILNCFHQELFDATIWDTNLSGQMIDGYKIQSPNLIDVDPNLLENSWVILAFTSDKNYKTCSELLINAGFKNIINGSELLEQIASDEINFNYDEYKKINTDNNFIIDDKSLRVYTTDLYAPAGVSLNDEYLNQDLWAAKKVFAKKPLIHYDIGSRVDGFILATT